MELNERIKLIKTTLKERKLTYQDLSNMSNVPKPTLTNIFMGYTKNPRIDTVEAMENALHLNEEKAPTVVSAKSKLLDALAEHGIFESDLDRLTANDIDAIALIAKQLANKKNNS